MQQVCINTTIKSVNEGENPMRLQDSMLCIMTYKKRWSYYAGTTVSWNFTCNAGRKSYYQPSTNETSSKGTIGQPLIAMLMLFTVGFQTKVTQGMDNEADARIVSALPARACHLSNFACLSEERLMTPSSCWHANYKLSTIDDKPDSSNLEL